MKEISLSIGLVIIGFVIVPLFCIGLTVGLTHSDSIFENKCGKHSPRIFYYNPGYKLGCFLGESPNHD